MHPNTAANSPKTESVQYCVNDWFNGTEVSHKCSTVYYYSFHLFTGPAVTPLSRHSHHLTFPAQLLTCSPCPSPALPYMHWLISTHFLPECLLCLNPSFPAFCSACLTAGLMIPCLSTFWAASLPLSKSIGQKILRQITCFYTSVFVQIKRMRYKVSMSEL